MTGLTKTANILYTATKTAIGWRSDHPMKSRVFTKAANRQRGSERVTING